MIFEPVITEESIKLTIILPSTLDLITVHTFARMSNKLFYCQRNKLKTNHRANLKVYICTEVFYFILPSVELSQKQALAVCRPAPFFCMMIQVTEGENTDSDFKPQLQSIRTSTMMVFLRECFTYQCTWKAFPACWVDWGTAPPRWWSTGSLCSAGRHLLLWLLPLTIEII